MDLYLEMPWDNPHVISEFSIYNAVFLVTKWPFFDQWHWMYAGPTIHRTTVVVSSRSRQVTEKRKSGLTGLQLTHRASCQPGGKYFCLIKLTASTLTHILMNLITTSVSPSPRSQDLFLLEQVQACKNLAAASWHLMTDWSISKRLVESNTVICMPFSPHTVCTILLVDITFEHQCMIKCTVCNFRCRSK